MFEQKFEFNDYTSRTDNFISIYDYKLIVMKCDIMYNVKKPKIEIRLKNDNIFTNDEVFDLIKRIGYYKDGNDVDDPIENKELIMSLYNRHNLCVKQINNIIYFDLPYVSLIHGLSPSRIEDRLIFYMIFNKASNLFKDIDNVSLSLSFDPNDTNDSIYSLNEYASLDVFDNAIDKYEVNVW